MRILAILFFASISMFAKSLVIATISDSASEFNATQRALIIKESRKLFSKDKPLFLEKNNLILKDDIAKARQQMQALQERGDIDVVIGIGNVSSHLLATLPSYNKVSIATVIVDTALQNIPRNGDSSGMKNLNYIVGRARIEQDLDFFQSAKKFENIGVLVHKRTQEVYGDLNKFLEAYKFNANVEFVYVNDNIEQSVARIPKHIEALYVTPVYSHNTQKLTKLITQINRQKKLPTYFLARTKAPVLLMNLREDESIKVARMVALNLQQVSLGERAQDLPVEYNNFSKVQLNMQVAREINFSPSWDMMLQSVVVNEFNSQEASVFNLPRVIDVAFEQNLSILRAKKQLEIAKLQVEQRKSAYLPTLNAQVDATQIDKDRASVSSFTSAQREYNGTLSLSQVLYSEDVNASYAIQKLLKNAQDFSSTDSEHVAIFEIVRAYLDVLRSQTTLDIRKENLFLMERNLELSKGRFKSGTTKRSDIYRWESEVATAQNDLLFARTALKNAKTSLKELLQISLQEDINLQDYDTTAELFRFLGKTPARLADNVEFLKALAVYLSEENTKQNPRLLSLEENIKAKQRELKNNKRAYYAPTLKLDSFVQRNFERDGGGANFVTPMDDTNWEVEFSLSLPLYEGGNKGVEVKLALEELNNLKLQRKQLKDNLASSIYQALEQLGSTYRAIEYRAISAQSSQKSYELMQDLYAQGESNAIDVLNAQNSALVSKLLHESSTYDYLENIASIYYVLGDIDIFYNAQKKEKIEKEFLNFISTYNGSVK